MVAAHNAALPTGKPTKQATPERPAFVWEGVDYPRVAPGIYEAVVVSWQGPEWVFAFGRQSLRVGFELLSENVVVSAFYNFGQNPRKPHIGQRSKYFRDWTMANGELPRRGDKMLPPDVFQEGQVFTVRVEDKAYAGTGVLYSQVTKILRVARRHDNLSIF